MILCCIGFYNSIIYNNVYCAECESASQTPLVEYTSTHDPLSPVTHMVKEYDY